MASPYEQYPHYVPIVKWQANERRALQHLDPQVIARVMPCIEVRDSKQHQMMLSEYGKIWKNKGLVDYSDPSGALTPTRQNELIQFLKLSTGSSTMASPVLSPYASSSTFSSIINVLAGRKIALRLRLKEAYVSADHDSAIQALMSKSDIQSVVDRLIVDLHCTPITRPDDVQVAALATSLSALKLYGFSDIHLASGAFPQSLQHISGAGEVERSDWDLWQRVAAAGPGTLVGFSDYGPLTPEWKEEILTRRGGRSVIRYALSDKWRIIRATSNKTTDSIAISQLMVGAYGAEFKGKLYSFGDLLIHDRADPASPPALIKCGQYHITEFWNHHIAFVVKDQY